MAVIRLCLALKLQTSASFRAIGKVIATLYIHMGIAMKTPSHSTILLWLKKYGHYELSKPRGQGGEWVIILDESVQFGQSKLLVVYGVPQSQIDFNRPLNYRDMTALALASRPSWNGEAIQALLAGIERSAGKILYAVADLGNPIKKALGLSAIPHVYDITHCISLAMGHIYGQDEDFNGFTKKMGHLRGAQTLGRMAHVLPPRQRAKARFMSLRPVSDWGISVLRLLDSPSPDFQQEKDFLAWVGQYRQLILELSDLNKMINEIQSILKKEGLSEKTVARCERVLGKAVSPRLGKFKKEMDGYFQRTMADIREKGLERVLCCSDILESAFGKYKNYLQANPMTGITNLSLSIAAFTGSLESEGMMQAFEKTTVNDIKEWTQENIGTTTLSRRLEVLNGVQ